MNGYERHGRLKLEDQIGSMRDEKSRSEGGTTKTKGHAKGHTACGVV